MGSRNRVVGIDGVEQRLQCRSAKPLGLCPHAVLAEKQSARRRRANCEWDEIFHAGPIRKKHTLVSKLGAGSELGRCCSRYIHA
ncbi:MAG: hypothetical protein QOD47_1567 [Gemmatimonadaceae bacterium]|jgi:hypothetical protein|nr:hypothetical protein [Gemmatimonadaceae bacterium]